MKFYLKKSRWQSDDVNWSSVSAADLCRDSLTTQTVINMRSTRLFPCQELHCKQLVLLLPACLESACAAKPNQSALILPQGLVKSVWRFLVVVSLQADHVFSSSWSFLGGVINREMSSVIDRDEKYMKKTCKRRGEHDCTWIWKIHKQIVPIEQKNLSSSAVSFLSEWTKGN